LRILRSSEAYVRSTANVEKSRLAGPPCLQ
jgi:hypothetical protein